MVDGRSDGGRLRGFGTEIGRAALVDIAGRAIVGFVLGIGALIAVLVWQGGSVPAWLAVAVVFVLTAGAITRDRRAARREGTLRREIGRNSEYSLHVQNSLDAIQRVFSGDVDAEIPYFLDQAVLEPAQRILSEKPAEMVRLSVLLPADDDPSLWSMRWSAGHSAIGKLKYAEPIKETLARHAYESGEPQYWPDTSKQTEFEQNPLASAPMRSLVSIPIKEGDEILGVFNAISSERDAFDDAEQTFLTSLAGVVAVAVSVWHKDQKTVAKSDRGQH